MQVCLFAHLEYVRVLDSPCFVGVQRFIEMPVAPTLGSTVTWNLDSKEFGPASFEVLEVNWNVDEAMLEARVCQEPFGDWDTCYGGLGNDSRRYEDRMAAVRAWAHFGFEPFELDDEPS